MDAVDKQHLNGAAGDREMITVRNPVTGEVVGSVPNMTAHEVREAAAHARAVQPAWQGLGVQERARLLRAWANALWRDRATAIQMIRSETGKTEGGAYVEIAVMDAAVDYYYRHAAKILRPQTRRAVFPVIQRARLYYRPYGVAGFITPWNYPFLNGIADLVAALVAGNTVLLKPSEITPFTALYAVDLMYQVGVPRDVVQVVTGRGETGRAVIDNVDYISFTGSTAVGRKVAVQAAERLIPCTLELGGKDPLIVLNDADVELAAAGALRGAFENAGQTCISVERCYVESGIYEPFVDKVLEYASQITLGADGGYDVHVGSLTNERELLRTEEHIEDAVAKGARILCGGKRRPDLGPLFYEPTVLVDVDHTMRVMTEETFGPILPIMRVRDADHAIQLANDSDYGLAASIYSRDARRAEQLARRIQAGDVSINRPQMVFATPSLPMGGIKQSGLGRRNGPEGLLRFVNTQSMLIENTIVQPPALTHADPLTRNSYALLRVVRNFLPLS
jgi:succinate-semialdehyde dehydrogenase/glutarate-semialdehyde dehydrogenase